MEFFGLLGILAIFTILIGSIMGFVANSRISRLEIELKKLRRELQKESSPQQLKSKLKPSVKEMKASLLESRDLGPVVKPKSQEPPQSPVFHQKPKRTNAKLKVPPKKKKVRRSFE